MSKKFITVLAACMVFTSSFNIFSQEISAIAVEQPVTEQPITEEPIIEEPIIEEPITEEPIIEEPITEEPIIEEPITEEPVIEQPLVGQTKEVILQLDNTLVVINGVESRLNTPPKVINGNSYLPIRFVADHLLEADTKWDDVTKKMTITKGDKKIEIKVGSKQALLNGETITLAPEAISDGNVTYLPLRAIATLFDIKANYDPVTRTITLSKEADNNIAINPMISAEFTFTEEMYTEGQEIKAVDETKETVTDRRWMVNFNSKQTSSKLENIFKTPKAGLYSISLKVRNAEGFWSDWTTNQILINPNLKPVITKLGTTKSSIAQGESIEFTYEYENEIWEGIKAERWTYRKDNEPLAKSVVDKPQFIFDKGEYSVMLQLQDEFGNWSDRKEVTVSINEESKQSELEYRFTKGSIGDIIDNFKDFNFRSYKEITPSETSFGPGKLMMSNSPESVKAIGILYKDTLEGSGRILMHHTNEFTEEENEMEHKRLVLMAENTTDAPIEFVIANRIVKGPAEDALYVGQQMLRDYLRGDGHNTFKLNPGEKRYIYDSGSRRWRANQSISSQMDFHSTGKVTFTVAAVNRRTAMSEIEKLPKLAKDAHPRGTFNTTDIYQKIELTEDEPTMLLIGTGDDHWIEGYDAITGLMVKNRGNFGITYHLKITAKNDIGIILNPRAGMFRGAVKWDGNITYLTPSKGFFSGHNSKAVMLGTIKAGETRLLEYILPNGSASPVLLGFIPKNHWNK